MYRSSLDMEALMFHCAADRRQPMSWLGSCATRIGGARLAGARGCASVAPRLLTVVVLLIAGVLRPADIGYTTPAVKLPEFAPLSDVLVPTEQFDGLAAGTTTGSGAVASSGTATYTIPLWTPAGRAGIQPNLALNYSSRAGNGVVGVGWGLSGLPRITRCARTHLLDGEARAIQFADGDRGDRFCLNGERLVTVGGRAGPSSAYGADGTEYRTEHDNHSKLLSYAPDELGPTYFRVFLRDGRILTLGQGG
jgi:Salmonella virulence plasmid 65kDa B protein